MIILAAKVQNNLHICKNLCNFARFFYELTMKNVVSPYPHRISKDLLQWLPVAAFEGEVVVVDREEQIQDAVNYLRTQSVLGVDTESRPSFKRGIHPLLKYEHVRDLQIRACDPDSRTPL